MNKKLKILFISGVSPYHFGNLGWDRMNALEMNGHEVDYLTLKDFKGQKKNMYSIINRTYYEIFMDYLKSFKVLITIKRLFFPKIKLRKTLVTDGFIRKNGLMMVNYDERITPCDEQFLLNSIKKSYDLIITLVWEQMLSAKSLEIIYNKMKCPIIVCPADTFPFTGGCQYFGNCKGYTHECGKCPILNSNDANDQTHINFLYKKNVYRNIPCALFTNSYMMDIASKAGMFSDSIKVKTLYTLNEHVYKPLDVFSCRKDLNIPKDKRFVMFARYVNPEVSPRKGIKILFEAVNLLCKKVGKEKLSSMCLVFAGDDCHELKSNFPITVINLRKLNTTDLIKAYSAATVFASPTIDDAGPSMVNQSIMCGTPVVCYNIGTAIDVVRHEENGYKATKLGDVEEFSNGLFYYYQMNESRYIHVRNSTRKIALELQSLKKYADKIEYTYLKLREQYIN